MPLHQFLKLFRLPDAHPWNTGTAFIGQDGKMLETRVAIRCALPHGWLYACGAGAALGGAVYLTIESYTYNIKVTIPRPEDELLEEALYQFHLIQLLRKSGWRNGERLERCANACEEIVELDAQLPGNRLPSWPQCMKHCGW